MGHVLVIFTDFLGFVGVVTLEFQSSKDVDERDVLGDIVFVFK
jgi:hypothetical protein